MNKPIQITFLTTGLLRGGAESVLLTLVRRLDRTVFRPTVVTLRDGGPLRSEFAQAEIPVVSPRMNPGFPSPFAWLRLRTILQQLRPDVLQGWMYHGNVVSAWMRRFAGSPRLFFGIHNSVYDLRAEKHITAWIIKRGAELSKETERVIYCAQSTAQQHESLGYDSSRSAVVHNGFDTDVFKREFDAAQELRNELEIGTAAPVIGMFARFDPHKDHANFFAAARLIADRLPLARFVLAGKGIESGNTALVALMHSNRIGEHVHLLGERTDMPFLMSGVDVVVSASSSEAFPMVLGEAQACETLCCTTDVGDSALLVGGFGKVVESRNPKALAEGTLAILSMSAEERATLGGKAREHVAKRYSVQAMVEKYAAAYYSQYIR